MPPGEVLLELYRGMVVGRRFDAQATALTKQGRLAVYPSSRGQDACQVGAVLALREQDWLFPTYRDSMADRHPGRARAEVLSLLRGEWHCGYDPYDHRVAPQCTPLATNTLHAVGLAHAARLKGTGEVALAHGRRRRDQRGRHPRGAELRGASGGRPWCSSCRTTATRSASRWPSRPRRPRWPTRASATASRPCWSTATTPPPCYAVVGDAVERRRGRRRPHADRGAHLPDRGAHQRRRRHPLPRTTTRSRPGSPATRSRGWRRYLRARGLLDDARAAAVRDEAEAFAAAAARAPERRCRRSTRRPVRATSTPSRRRQLARSEPRCRRARGGAGGCAMTAVSRTRAGPHARGR